MNIAPNRTLGISLGVIWLLLLFGAIGASLAQLGQGLISPTSLLWFGMLLIAIPLVLLVINRLYGLLTASYRIDRDGFYVRWGLAFEQVPLDSINRVELAANEPSRPKLGFWWPGCLVGEATDEDGHALEFFATAAPLLSVWLESGRILIISPPDIQAFEDSLMSATRMGSLEAIQARSERADAVVSGIWRDRTARWLILAGLLIPLVLTAALVVLAPALGDAVPFGFAIDGSAEPLVPPGRLLLIPFIAALIWAADLISGAWFFNQESDRPIAYALWGVAILAGLLLTAATVQLIRAGA